MTPLQKQMLDDYNSGMLLQELADKYVIPYQRLRSMLLNAGVTLRSRHETSKLLKAREGQADPTPAEIAERAAEIRQRNIEMWKKMPKLNGSTGGHRLSDRAIGIPTRLDGRSR